MRPVPSRLRHRVRVVATAVPRAFLSLLSPTTNRKCVTRRRRSDVNFRPALTSRMRTRHRARQWSDSSSPRPSLREGSGRPGRRAFLAGGRVLRWGSRLRAPRNPPHSGVPTRLRACAGPGAPVAGGSAPPSHRPAPWLSPPPLRPLDLAIKPGAPRCHVCLGQGSAHPRRVSSSLSPGGPEGPSTAARSPSSTRDRSP